MTGASTTKIYMINKRQNRSIVSFQLGTKNGIKPGMRLEVVNEDGFVIGSVEIQKSTESESEATVVGESNLGLGSYVKLPRGKE